MLKLVVFFSAALVTVTQCRVTFTYSSVLQETDLDADKTARFLCGNGCYVYSNSQDPDMFIFDGEKDASNFLVMGLPDRPQGPTYLLPWKDYQLQYRGKGAPPRFVFYVVDKYAPFLDTPVHAVSNEVGFLVDPSLSRRFTLLRSFDPAPQITFEGEFAEGYPRIYATGFDAVAEDMCSPVYQARSQESAHNSWLSIASPILTVDKGPAVGKQAVNVRVSGAFDKKNADSSVVYKSPGYVGCSYLHGQIYSNNSDTVLDSISADVKSLEFFAYLNIPTADEAVRITVNNEPVSLYGVGTATRHFDAASFDITISWIRQFTTTSNFAIQFDLGVPNNKLTTDRLPEVTTSSIPNDRLTTDRMEEVTTSSAPGTLVLTSLLIVFVALR